MPSHLRVPRLPAQLPTHRPAPLPIRVPAQLAVSLAPPQARCKRLQAEIAQALRRRTLELITPSRPLAPASCAMHIHAQAQASQFVEHL